MYRFLRFLTVAIVKSVLFFGVFEKNIEFCTLLKKYNPNNRINPHGVDAAKSREISNYQH
jgi:hypothetical protein